MRVCISFPLSFKHKGIEHPQKCTDRVKKEKFYKGEETSQTDVVEGSETH